MCCLLSHPLPWRELRAVECLVSESVSWEGKRVAPPLKYMPLYVCTGAGKTRKLAMHLEWKVVVLVTRPSFTVQVLDERIRKFRLPFKKSLGCEWRIWNGGRGWLSPVILGRLSEVAFVLLPAQAAVTGLEGILVGISVKTRRPA